MREGALLACLCWCQCVSFVATRALDGDTTETGLVRKLHDRQVKAGQTSQGTATGGLQTGAAVNSDNQFFVPQINNYGQGTITQFPLNAVNGFFAVPGNSQMNNGLGGCCPVPVGSNSMVTGQAVVPSVGTDTGGGGNWLSQDNTANAVDSGKGNESKETNTDSAAPSWTGQWVDNSGTGGKSPDGGGSWDGSWKEEFPGIPEESKGRNERDSLVDEVNTQATSTKTTNTEISFPNETSRLKQTHSGSPPLGNKCEMVSLVLLVVALAYIVINYF